MQMQGLTSRLLLVVAAWALASSQATAVVPGIQQVDLEGGGAPFARLLQDQPANPWGDSLPILSSRNPSSQSVNNKQETSSLFANSIGTEGGSGKRCVNKVIMEQKTEYEDTIECNHSYDRRCYKTLTTVFEPTQEEECDDNYVKDCFIQTTKGAANVTTRICRRPLVRDCDTRSGDLLCSTQYETECRTSQLKHEVVDDIANCRTEEETKCEDITVGYTTSQDCQKWPKVVCSVKKEKVYKNTPETRCEKIPVELCGSKGCGFSEGEEECRDEVRTVVFDKPEETCSLDPRRVCKFVTKLVPRLKEVETCSDIPKEVCVRVQKALPRKVEYPVIKLWCYSYSCPQQCTEAAKKGICLPECEDETSPDCCPRRSCPQQCLEAARQGVCLPQQCESYSDLPGCKCETKCPQQCLAAVQSGSCIPECAAYENVPGCRCQRKCPNQCLAAVQTGQCTPECADYEDIPGCKCQRKCPAVCRQHIASGECHVMPSVCLGYADLPDCVCRQQCPQDCESARANQDCDLFRSLGCQRFSSIPGCDCDNIKSPAQPPSECPLKCSDAARWGECPADCREYSGNPDCCAPKCPAKCTNRRRGECSAGGVAECNGVPGCCPEKYDALYGDVTFGEGRSL